MRVRVRESLAYELKVAVCGGEHYKHVFEHTVNCYESFWRWEVVPNQCNVGRYEEYIERLCITY